MTKIKYIMFCLALDLPYNLNGQKKSIEKWYYKLFSPFKLYGMHKWYVSIMQYLYSDFSDSLSHKADLMGDTYKYTPKSWSREKDFFFQNKYKIFA